MAVLFQELRAFETAVKRIGLVSEGWLNPRELAAVVVPSTTRPAWT